jgi:hypothetical protein
MSTKKRQQGIQLSPYISGVCQLFEDSIADHSWSKNETIRMEKLTQDYLHKLELEDLKYADRAKIATQLTKCRQLRRGYKDTAEILEPLVQFLNSDRGKNLHNLLKEALGKTRQAEKRMEGRVYYPRVLVEED